ncbi:MAG: fimbrillin family protein [Bacteroidales bacterium]|nr:fimbrillin family protein [Bacteroidales bacterium]
MKKYLILAVTAAIAAVGCSKTFEVVPTPETPIGFSTWGNLLTKAISDPRTAGTSTFGVGDSFAVYGYKSASDDSGKATVFDDDAVEMTAAGTPGTWTYSPLRFWDKNYDKYVFYAISPSSVGTAATVDPQTGEITSASISFTGKNVASDVLVADKKTVLKANYGSTVELYFNHVSALVDFKVSKAPNLTDATVKVTAFSLSNIENAGVLTVSAAYNASVYGSSPTGLNPVATWSTGNATGSYGPGDGVTTVTLGTGLVIDENDAFTHFDGTDNGEPADGKSTFVINNLIVKPQPLTAPTNTTDFTETKPKLSITYTITTGTGSSESTTEYTSQLWLSQFDIVNDNAQNDTPVDSWATGKHYVFYITLDSNPIVFGASITDWTSSNGYYYLVN